MRQIFLNQFSLENLYPITHYRFPHYLLLQEVYCFSLQILFVAIAKSDSYRLIALRDYYEKSLDI